MIDADGNWKDDDDDDLDGRRASDFLRLCEEIRAASERNGRAYELVDSHLGNWTEQLRRSADATAQLTRDERRDLAAQVVPLESTARRAALLANALRNLAAAIRR
jgi:hypothetical protein